MPKDNDHPDPRTGRRVRPRTRRAEGTRDRRPRRARRHLHPQRHQGAASARGRRTRAAVRGSPPAWIAGTTMLALSKILDNMEIGHNVMHGQYDWMGDPAISSRGFEWDTACPGDQWRHSHNYMHHTHTNIVGMDRDIGYGILRMSEDQRWQPVLPGQPGLRVPADGAVPVRRRAARVGDRAHPVRRDHAGRQARHPRGHLAQDQAPDAQGLRRVPAAGRPVRAVRVRRQPDRQPGPQHLVVHDHLLRPLPRRTPRSSRSRKPRTRAAACGTSARSSDRRT